MISNIYIKNFKSLRETPYMPVSNFNLFTGMNGMGKSSLIQIILLLRQSYNLLRYKERKQLKLNGRLIELGTTSDVITENRKDNQLVIDFILSSDAQASFKFNYIQEEQNNIYFDLDTTSTFDNDFWNSSIFNDNFEYLNAERISPKLFYKNEHYFQDNLPLGKHGQNTIKVLNELKNSEISIRELFNPKGRYTDITGNYKIDFNFITQLNAWLSEISPNIVFKPEVDNKRGISNATFSFKQIDKAQTNYYQSQNVGFGITYVLPVVTALLKAKKGDIIIIENPEAHIHPKGQSKLTELMAKAAQNGVQLFVETHSDHVFYSLRVAVKERLIDYNKTNINFFYRDKQEHISRIENILIDDEGRIDKYPEDFFDQYDINLTKLI